MCRNGSVREQFPSFARGFSHSGGRVLALCCLPRIVAGPIVSAYALKILCTADLHLVPTYRDKVLETLAREISREEPDALIVAGDLATAGLARPALEGLRKLLPDGQIALAFGNHDFWVNANGTVNSTDEVVDQYWVPAAAAFGIHLLDRETAWLGDLPVVGGYGHYDYGFAWPGLRFEGRQVTGEDYASGVPPWPTRLRWRDFDQFPIGSNTPELAAGQVRAIEERLMQINGRSALVVLHTPPLAELLGIGQPWQKGLFLTGEQRDYAFFRAYLGNRAMGEMLLRRRQEVQAVICGHTHRRVEPADLEGFWGANIGSDYGRPKTLVLALESHGAVVVRTRP
jgi:3',5'-cyclic AMP phosphodiesterase CpdA